MRYITLSATILDMRTTAIILAVFMFTVLSFGMVGCNDNSEPQPMLSGIDHKPMTAGSLHCGRVKLIDFRSFYNDRGEYRSAFFTSGTGLSMFDGPKGFGILCASVPSYENDDNDSTYYFQSFKPE